jgi:hypothetical protein
VVGYIAALVQRRVPIFVAVAGPPDFFLAKSLLNDRLAWVLRDPFVRSVLLKGSDHLSGLAGANTERDGQFNGKFCDRWRRRTRLTERREASLIASYRFLYLKIFTPIKQRVAFSILRWRLEPMAVMATSGAS